MNLFDPMQWYAESQKHEKWMQDMNRMILHTQLFERAKAKRIISIYADIVSVIDMAQAKHVFGHQPDMLTPALSQALHDESPERLGIALTEIWRKLNRR